MDKCAFQNHVFCISSKKIEMLSCSILSVPVATPPLAKDGIHATTVENNYLSLVLL